MMKGEEVAQLQYQYLKWISDLLEWKPGKRDQSSVQLRASKSSQLWLYPPEPWSIYSAMPCLTTFSLSYCCGPLGGYGSIHSHVNRRAALTMVRNRQVQASTALCERYLTSIVFTMLKASTLSARVEPSAQPLSIALGIKRS